MKKVIWVAALLSLFVLTSCGLNKNSTTENTRVEQQKRQQTIEKNRRTWDKQVKSATKYEVPGDKSLVRIPNGYQDEDMSWTRFKNGNQLVVQAQVINLQPEFGRLFVNNTKATIYIKKVISGDKNLQGENIKTEFSGGLAKAGDYFNNFEGQYDGASVGFPDKKTVIYATTAVKPIPKIGQRIVIGLKRFDPAENNDGKVYAKLGLTAKNFYVINNPEVTFWVKKDGKYRLNNPAFYQKKNQGLYPNIQKITAQLNKD